MIYFNNQSQSLYVIYLIRVITLKNVINLFYLNYINSSDHINNKIV